MSDRVRKIRLNGSEIEIQVERTLDGGLVEVAGVKSPATAREEFYTTLQDLGDILLDTLELPSEYRSGMKMVGVSISYRKGYPIVELLAEKEIRGYDKPLKLKTPAGAFTKLVMREIDRMCALAIDYHDGARAQLRLPLREDRPDHRSTRAPRRTFPGRGW